MCTVGYGIFLLPEKLARRSFKLSVGDPCGEPTEEEHLQAIFSCIEKKWLEIVESERQIGEDILEVGVVDFTISGFALFRHIINKIFGNDFRLGYETL